MYYTTGFSREQILELCVRLHDTGEFTTKATGRRRALGLYRALVLTLSFLRRARAQQELAEDFGVSQPTVSRVITRLPHCWEERWKTGCRWWRSWTPTGL